MPNEQQEYDVSYGTPNEQQYYVREGPEEFYDEGPEEFYDEGPEELYDEESSWFARRREKNKKKTQPKMKAKKKAESGWFARRREQPKIATQPKMKAKKKGKKKGGGLFSWLRRWLNKRKKKAN